MEHSSNDLPNARELEALAPKLRGFSCPQEILDESFFTLIATMYRAFVVDLFLEKHGAYLKKRSEGLVSLLKTGLELDALSEEVWADLALGGAFTVIRTRNTDAVPIVAASLALQLSARPFVGQWDVDLGRPVRLTWKRWLLPLAERITFTRTIDYAKIQTSLAACSHESSFYRSGDDWKNDVLQPLSEFGTHGSGIILLPRSALCMAGVPEVLETAIEAIDASLVARMQEAIELIAAHAPVYLPWVQRAVRYVVLTEPGQVLEMNSGSWDHDFGLIQVSANDLPAAIAEMLVHEASHQYFRLLCHLKPFDDGTDIARYYSPTVKKERPLSRIGLAYHAFANIMLFYCSCLESGIKDGDYCERSKTRLAPDLRLLEIPIRQSHALTIVGRSLCGPLLERLPMIAKSTTISA